MRASRLAAGFFTLCIVGHAAIAQRPPLFARKQFPTGSSPISAKIADLDGDGSLDLVAADIASSTLSVLLNVDETLAPRVAYAVAPGLVDVAIGDVDGDGALDLLAANVFPGSVSVLRNLGDGTFAARVAHPAGFSVSALAVGDLNGDGALDVVMISTDVSVLLNQGNGSFGAPVS